MAPRAAGVVKRGSGGQIGCQKACWPASMTAIGDCLRALQCAGSDPPKARRAARSPPLPPPHESVQPGIWDRGRAIRARVGVFTDWTEDFLRAEPIPKEPPPCGHPRGEHEHDAQVGASLSGAGRAWRPRRQMGPAAQQETGCRGTRCSDTRSGLWSSGGTCWPWRAEADDWGLVDG